MGVDTAFSDSDALQESYNKEVQDLKTMLSEGWIQENKFADAMKSAWNKLKSGLNVVWNKLVEWMSKIAEQVKDIINSGFHSIMEYFHIDYNVNADVRLI